MIRRQVAVIGLLAAMVFAGCHCDDNTVLEARKDGTGKGTVTSKLLTMPGPVGRELDCGEKCTLATYFKNTYLLTATPAPGSHFVRWDYDQCPPELVRDSLDCEVSMVPPGPTVVTATFNENRLTVTKAGVGSGRVVSSPAGIDCGSSCSTTFDTKTSVTLTATAEAGSTFTGWSGACSGATTTCTLTALDAQNVTATFVKAPGTLNVTKAGSGTGSVISMPSGIDCGTTCSAMYETGTVVTLTPMPASGSAFAGWSGACSGMSTCAVTVQEVVSVTATFTTVSLPLSVRFSGVGSGRVTSLPAGIDCTGDCMSTFTTGTMVTLTAFAGTGSVFSGWGGACMGAGACTVTLSAAAEVVATFAPAPIALTVVRAGTGSGTVTSMPAGIDCGTTCTASFTAATTVTLTATPDASSIFTGWSGACTGMTTCTVPLMVASTVTATFQRREVSVSVMLLGTGSGFVTSSPAGINCGATCSANFALGTMVTLTPMATPGSTFTGWSGACTGNGACVVPAMTATAVGATFTLDAFPLTVSKAGTGGGTVSSNPAGISCGTTCLSSWVSGTVVTLIAMADSSSTFAGWSGACSGTGSCVVTLSAAQSVTATFTRQQFALSVMRTGAGTGTVTSNPAGISCGATCSASYDAGAMVTLTATAATGSTFSGWSGGGCTGTAPCTITVSAATSVSANFDRVQYAFSVIRTGTGGGTVTSVPSGISCGTTCATQLFHGDRITLTAASDQNSTFAGWSGPCTGTNACVVDVTSATTVTATFTRSVATLAVTTAGTGSGTVTSSPAGISCGATCVSAFDVGSVITLTASAAGSSTFTGWSGAGCTGTGTCTVTLAAAASVTATFTLNRYTVSVAKAGTGTGSVVSSPAGISCGATCSADFDHASVVVLTAVAGASSTFTGWSGSGCSGTGTCTVTMTSAQSVIATFGRTQRTLTVVRAGAGAGTVTSVPAGIACGATCAAPFDDGSVVALTATASPGSTFTGWSGSGCSGTGTCAISMTAATTVTATFQPTQYTLAVSKAGTGTGTVNSAPAGIACGATCSASFLEGALVTLTAAQDPSSTFAGWSGGGCTGTGSCTVTMAAATSVTATFTLNQYTLAVARLGTGTGTVNSVPSGIACGATCNASFDSGTIVTLTAAAGPNSTFAGWSGACTGTGSCTVTLSAAQTVLATFNITQFQLQVLKTGTGGGLVTSSPARISCGATCSASFDTPTVVTLTAAQDSTSTFTGWSGEGCTGTGPCTVTMNAARTVAANFTKNQYALQVVKTGTGGGSVVSSPAGISCGATCNANFDASTVVTLTAAQDGISFFAGWSGAGCSGTGPCTVTMSAARTVTATFTRIQYALQVVKAGTGGGTVISSPGGISCGASCNANFDATTVVTLTATQDPTSSFTGWSGAGCTGTGTCTVTMSAARTVTATFDTVTWPLTVSKSGSGTGTVASIPPSFINCGATCSTNVVTGTSLSLTATASPGSTFAGWTGACSGTGPCTVLVNAPVSVGAVFVLPNFVFATSISVSAAMGGLGGADSICAQRALAGGLAGTFKAWLSTSTTSAISRLGSASGWVRPDGLPFANSQADLVAGRILYPLRLDEFGTDVFATKAFTSTLGEGTLNGGVSTCSDWTSTIDQIPAGAGLTSLSTTGWTTGAFAPCGSQQRLYCFGVDAPASVKATAPAQLRRAFVTTATWTPGGGIGSADAVCANEAFAANLSGTYLALLTPQGVSAATRFNVMGAPWVRVDDVSLSPTANSFFIDPFWKATLNVTPARAYGSATTWSGSTNLLFQGAPSNTCQNWTSASVNDSANAGVMNDSEVSHAFGGAGTFDCSNAMRLMCLEQ